MLYLLKNKLNALIKKIKNLDSVLVAFSGGTDSTLLLAAAKEAVGKKCLGVTIDAPIFSREEISQAQLLAQNLGIRHMIIKADPLIIPEFKNNVPQRCYYCKRNLFEELIKLARHKNIPYILDGTNADDSFDYRPGLRAIKELGIISPLREVGLTKGEIREILKEWKFSNWNRASQACLATRIPYGEQITPKKLRQVEQAERFLKNMGFSEMRVRLHGPIARIEIPEEHFKLILHRSTRKKITAAFESLGIPFTAVDLSGFRSGSLNRLLPKEENRNNEK